MNIFVVNIGDHFIQYGQIGEASSHQGEQLRPIIQITITKKPQKYSSNVIYPCSSSSISFFTRILD